MRPPEFPRPAPLPFDRHVRPKPAFFAMLHALLQAKDGKFKALALE